MTISLKNIEAIVWDFDGVHYPYAALPPWDRFDNLKAIAATKVLPSLTFKEALRMGAQSYQKYSDAVTVYTNWAREQGLDHRAIRDQIFKEYNRALFNRVAANHSQIFQPDPQVNAAFQKCRDVIKHGIATHSSVEFWIKPIMTLQDRLQFFTEEAMIGLDDVDYSTKHEGVIAVRTALDRLNTAYNRAAFCDDLTVNLERSKDLDADLVTVLVHHGKALDQLPPYIDLQVDTPQTLMRMIARAHKL